MTDHFDCANYKNKFQTSHIDSTTSLKLQNALNIQDIQLHTIYFSSIYYHIPEFGMKLSTFLDAIWIERAR